LTSTKITVEKKSIFYDFFSKTKFRFIVRDFVYDEEAMKHGKNERDKLVQEKQRQYAPLVRWLKINFGEIFGAYVHVKALRVFVESVLR
jgi:V-type H+-transporting ATPase subunit C